MSSVHLASSYVCDTLPAARLASADSPRGDTFPEMTFETPHIIVDDMPMASTSKSASPEQETPVPPARKLCVRHQRMADEGTNLKLQQVSCFFLCQFVFCLFGLYLHSVSL
jgi:F-box/WD-40 domain protein MET30